MNKLILLLFIVFPAIINASGDASLGEKKSQTCLGCHGVQGNSVISGFPKLAGQGYGYLIKQMQDFKSGARFDAVMAGQVAILSEKDIEDISAYYSSQTISSGLAKNDADIELGQKIYRGGKRQDEVTACIACHGPKGSGIPSARFPALASQHAQYLVKQLQAFRQYSINKQTGASAPSRSNDYEGMMTDFSKSLTNVEIEAVSQYIAGLR